MNDTINICLLLNKRTIPQWQATAIANLFTDQDVQVTTIIYNEVSQSRTILEKLHRARKLREWAVVGPINDLLFGQIPERDPIPITSIIDINGAEEHSVSPTIIDGWKQRLPADVIEAAAAEADLAIRLGFGFIIGPVLTAFDHGVLSYHHGDLRKYRGQPMGFWEFINDENTAGVTVQQLTDELDGGRIAALKTFDIRDVHTWEELQQRLLRASEPMLTEAVRSIRDGNLQEPTELGKLYTHPKGTVVGGFFLKNTVGHLIQYTMGNTRSNKTRNQGPQSF